MVARAIPQTRPKEGQVTRAVIWDFDETLARRTGRWRDMLVDLMDAESPGHGLTAADLEPGLSRGWPWHDWQKPHPELSDPDRWWDHLGGLLGGALEGAGVGNPLAARVLVGVRTEYTRLDRWVVFPDAIPALERLRELGWRHVILSNHCPELPDLVRGLGLWDYFDAVLTSAATGFEKPHPEAYALALHALGRPETVWMVGDNPEVDYHGARRCGIPGVLVRQPAPGCDHAPDLTTAAEMIISRTARSGPGQRPRPTEPSARGRRM
jgi:putative hydrolase of the HAD superfamily